MPPIPNTVRTNIIWNREGVPTAINALHWIVPPSFVVNGTATSAFNSVVTTAAAAAGGSGSLAAWLHQDWQIAGVSMRDLRIPNQPEFTANATYTGAATGSGIPSANAVVVTLRTALAGRSFRGRVYVPGWGSNAVSSTGNISTTAQDIAEEFVTEINNGANALSMDLAVASRTLLESNEVTSIDCRDNQWDTQRRRNVPGI